MMSLLMATCSLLHSLFLCMMSHTDMLLNLSANCQTDQHRGELLLTGGIPMGIGKNSVVKRAIVDKNARIGSNVKV